MSGVAQLEAAPSTWLDHLIVQDDKWPCCSGLLKLPHPSHQAFQTHPLSILPITIETKEVHTTIIPSKTNSPVEQSTRKSCYSTHYRCFQEWDLCTKSLDSNFLPTIPFISLFCTPSTALFIPVSLLHRIYLFLHAPSTLHTYY